MTRRMPPSKVIECQADLNRRLRIGDLLLRLCIKVVHTQISEGSFRGAEENRRQTTIAIDHLINAAREAEAYHVSEDMTQLVAHAASLLDETDRFDSDFAPSPSGIVRFDGGLPLVDVRGNVLHLDWMLWAPAFTRYAPDGQSFGDNRPGVIFFEFNDAHDNPDMITLNMMDEMGERAVEQLHGRWAFHGINQATDDQSVGPALIDIKASFPDWYVSLKAAGGPVAPATNSTRYLLALWMLMNQEIVVKSEARPAHPSVTKAAKKEKVKPKVTVVELRRRRHPSGAAPAPGRAVDWSHRWWVNGFWRWQPYGPKQKQRRRTWIDGYTKGPEDKPLVIKNKVYDLRR